jgi:hypothetical protein
LDEIIRFLYSFKFTAFGIDIDSGNLIDTVQKLTNFSQITQINIWSIGKVVNDCIIPIALSLLILFFMINLIKKSIEIEKISWERVAMAFVSFFILKYFIQNGYTFLTSIMNVVNNIFVTVTNSLVNVNTNINIADTIIEAVPNKFVDSILTYRTILNTVYSIYDYNCSDIYTNIFKGNKTNIVFCFFSYTNCLSN